MRTSHLLITAAAFAVAASSGSAWAQAYPERPITIVVPVTPGGGTDTIVRLMADKLSDSLGVEVIVDNQPGAGGNIAGEIVANAEPDGYTLLAVTAAHATNPALYSDMAFDPFTDLDPIIQLSSQPYLLVVPAALPVNTLEEFIDYAKNKPEGLTYASSGAGLLGHLGMELLRLQADFEAVHIPYGGAGPAMVDTIAGRTEAFFPTIVSGAPQVAGGAVKALGVTSAERSDVLPDVPTIAEQGYPDYVVEGWYGILAPAGTPTEITALLQEEIKKALDLPEVAERIIADGATPVGSTAEEFRALIEEDNAKWAQVIEEAGVNLN